MANRDHLGGSIIDNRRRQDEAEPLFPFFEADYILRDRLIYAVEGTDWVQQWYDEEMHGCI